MLTPTTIERLDEKNLGEIAQSCPFATDSCFCSQHSANKKDIGWIALDTQAKDCPQGRILRLGKNVYRVLSIFTEPNRKKKKR